MSRRSLKGMATSEDSNVVAIAEEIIGKKKTRIFHAPAGKDRLTVNLDIEAKRILEETALARSTKNRKVTVGLLIEEFAYSLRKEKQDEG